MRSAVAVRVRGEAGLLLVLAALLVGCGAADEPGAAAPPSVLLVTIDALRCDALGAEGWQQRLLPNLTALRARDEAWSGCAVAASSVPETALASLLTGVDPLRLGRRAAEPGSRIGGLALLLESHGYETRALLASPPPPVGGVIESFQVAERQLGVAEVLQELARLPQESPWFTWVHLSRTRPPWAAVDAYRARLLEGERGRAVGEISRGELARLAQAEAPRRERARLLHRLNMAAVDNQLGLLLDELARAPGRDRVLVAVVGSEGVDLGETEESGFATGLSRPQLEVAMVLVDADAARAARAMEEGTPVSATRLAATLARSAGFSRSPAMEAALGEPRASAPVSVFWTRLGARLSWIDGDRQWLVSRRGEQWQEPWSRGWTATGGAVGSEPGGAVPEALKRRIEGTGEAHEAPWDWSAEEALGRAGR